MLSNDDREALMETRREMRHPRSRRGRTGRPGKHSYMLAYSMWVVMGALLIVLGILGGLAYVRETAEVPADDPELVVETDPADAAPAPAAKHKPKPKPVATRPDPEIKRRKREVERPVREAEAPKPKPTGPTSLEDAGGSEASQREMRDRSLAVVARSEEIARRGTFTNAERKKVSGLTQRGRAILASRDAAYEEKRWSDVIRHTREKNANTDEHESYLNGVETRQREASRQATEEAERKEAERKARAPSPAVQEIHDLLDAAIKAREASRSTKSRVQASGALSKTMEKAWRLTSRLKGSDRSRQTELRIFIHNSRGECQEVLAELARHRRPQEVMKVRARTQGHAVLAYERALKMGNDAVYSSGISARAWALHRIAVLSAKIAKHHTARQASYIKLGKVTYPQASRIFVFRNKSHAAIARLKADYPNAKDQAGRLLSSIIEE